MERLTFISFQPKVKSFSIIELFPWKQSLLWGLRYITMIWWPISTLLYCAHVSQAVVDVYCIPKVIRGGDPSQDLPLWKYRQRPSCFFLEHRKWGSKNISTMTFYLVKNEWEKTRPDLHLLMKLLLQNQVMTRVINSTSISARIENDLRTLKNSAIFACVGRWRCVCLLD